LVAILQAANTR